MNTETINAEKDWSATATHFDVLQDYVVGDHTTQLVLSKLASIESLGEVLELGCGNGTFTRAVADNARKIVATDCSPEMAAAAGQRLHGLDNVSVEVANCYQTEYPDQAFDTVFMANLIHVVERPDLAVAESRRLLRPGGRLLLLSFTMDGMKLRHAIPMIFRYLKAFGKPPKKATPFKLDSLCDFVQQNGFAVEHRELLGDKSKAMLVLARRN